MVGVANAGTGGVRAGEAECAAGDAATTCSRDASGVQTHRPIREENSIIAEQYIASLRDNSSLHVDISDQVATSYNSQREVCVFSLFFTSTLKDRLRKWTSDVLALDGHTAVTESEFNAYLVTLHPPEHPTFDKERDPLWRCRGIMEHFQKHFAEFAVPVDVSSIDEMTVRTKARTRARTFMPSKSDRYGVHFTLLWDGLLSTFTLCEIIRRQHDAINTY
ncbi:PiggyBac transposable element-derived protein [Phytophthora cactorum]|nr:PiggyBac transposable element-derived protein [Phytophthora cactorum]